MYAFLILLLSLWFFFLGFLPSLDVLGYRYRYVGVFQGYELCGILDKAGYSVYRAFYQVTIKGNPINVYSKDLYFGYVVDSLQNLPKKAYVYINRGFPSDFSFKRQKGVNLFKIFGLICLTVFWILIFIGVA